MKMRLEDCIVTTIDNRGRNPQAYFSQGKYPVIDNFLIKNTLHPDLSAATRFIDEETFRNFLRGYVHKDMPIMTLVGNGIGNVSLAPSDNCAIIQNTIGFLVNENIDQTFLYYYFLYEQDRIRKFDRGSGQPSIRKTDILAMEIDIPNKETQKKIAAILRGLDEKIESNNRINDNLQHLLRMMFSEMFITNAEKCWPVKKLGDFLSLERGLSYKGKYLSDNEGVPMLNLGNILPNSVFREEKLKFYTGEFKPRHVVLPGDIIVANTDLTQAREVLGSAIRVPDLGYDTAICSHHISIVRNSKISNNFILGLLNMPEYRSRVAGFATGTTVLALPNETILNCEFQCPTNDAIQKYDNLANSAYAIMENKRLENHKLVALRDSLLPQLMAGEIAISEVLA